MSFPNIPDITPDINITFEEAINLLLTSIAMEEVSLSKLLDAETNKIQCVLDDCKHKDSLLNDAIRINKSVDDTIKNMIKMQMLLQFKLENIKEIIPTTSTTTTTSTSTCTTSTCTRTHSSSCTTTHTTTCTTSTCSTTTKKECNASLLGTGKGCVSNKSDEFYGQTAILNASISCCDIRSRSLRYSVQNETNELHLYSYANNITIQCPCNCSEKIIIRGKGNVVKQPKSSDNHSIPVNYILTVWNIAQYLEFHIEITSGMNHSLIHNSGIVQVKNSNTDSDLKICCEK